MRKKSLWSTMLTFVAAVAAVIALGGMTVLAEGDVISFSIDEFTIDHSGYSYVNYHITSLEFGEFYDYYGTGHVITPNQVRFNFYGGTLECGNNSIDFDVAEDETFHSPSLDSYDFCNGVGQSSTLYLYVDPDAYRAAESGIYTGKLKIVPVWWEDWDYKYDGDPFYIDISLIINEKAGDNIEWRFDDEMMILRIEGTGPMNDFDSPELAPWYGIKDDIHSVIIGDGVTYIGSNSFDDYQVLDSVYIPRTVTSIASDAFAECTGVNSVVLCSNPDVLTWDLSGFGPSTMFKVPKRFFPKYRENYPDKLMEEYILGNGGSCGTNDVSWFTDGDNALVISGTGSVTEYYSYDNTPWYRLKGSISEIVISDGIENIPSYAFYNFEKLESISIAPTVTSIGKYAFYGCEALRSASIPESVTSIGNDAFHYCKRLASANIPGNITRIEGYTFGGCNSLTSIYIPGNVTVIDYYAFYECFKLEEINLPSGLTKLGNGAFAGCSSLKSISIPSGVTELGYEMFQNCDSLTEVTIPSNVVTIGVNAFYSCENLKKVTIEDGVFSIGQYAFGGCSKLETVTIPNSILSIDMRAFSNCSLLQDIVLPEGLTRISYDAFYDCDSLTSVTIPSTAVLESYVFEGCDGIKTVVFSDGCKSVSEYAFNSCTSLESVTIPDSVTSIGNGAFMDCTSLESVNIPGSVNEIGAYAFMNCTSLAQATLGDGIKTISSQAFYNCSSLSTITIPSTVSTIWGSVFNGCKNITDVYCFADPMILNWYSNNSSFKPDKETKCHVFSYYLHDYETHHEYLNATYVGDLENINMGEGTHLYGYSLSLDGSIGVNFYMTLEESVTAAGSNAYMLFTVNGYTQKVFVKDITPDGDGYYIFKCRVAAKEMADVINARLYVDDAIPTDAEYNFCVRQYANYILKRPAFYSEETVALVKAMLNYGAYSQIYFKHNTSNLANSVLPSDEQIVEMADENDLRPYTGGISVDGRLTFYSASLSTESETVMNFYFTDYESCDHLNFKLDDGTEEGKVLTKSFSGNKLRVSVTNIPAHRIGDDYKIDIYEGSVLIGSITYSPVNYCYNVIHREITETRTEELKLNVSAYILFYQKAVEYVNSL